MYPTHVETNTKTILKLVKTYKRAQREIIKEIQTATDFGVANRKAILAQIDNTLVELGKQTAKTLQQELPLYYKSGADDAVKQLNNAGAEVNVKSGFNRIHNEAIKAIVDDTARAFGESMTGMKRSADMLLNKAVREEVTQRIAQGQIKGEALIQTRRLIKGVLQEQGLSALKDKAGRSWTLDRYSEMLLRTKAVEARNRGMANRMVENGYDLVQVSNHMSKHHECAVWESRILSTTGQTKGYPTVQTAEAAGLFHPNCKHAINAIVPALATRTKAYSPDERTKVISKAEIMKLSKA